MRKQFGDPLDGIFLWDPVEWFIMILYQIGQGHDKGVVTLYINA